MQVVDIVALKTINLFKISADEANGFEIPQKGMETF